MTDEGNTMDQTATIEAARKGDAAAFDELARPLMRPLRSFILRTVAHPDDADDLLQETLTKAHRGLPKYRAEASFKNWMYTIASRACLDHLRARKRWRAIAHVEAGEAAEGNPDAMDALAGIASTPDFAYSAREHIAFCFSCIGRVLPPDEYTALMLREVAGFTNRESAKMMGLSTSVFRHTLTRGRRSMMDTFGELCALISKGGICHMCAVLRTKVPPDRRGEPAGRIGHSDDTPEALLEARLAITRDADLMEGGTSGWHDLMFRMMAAQEEGRPLQ